MVIFIPNMNSAGSGLASIMCAMQRRFGKMWVPLYLLGGLIGYFLFHLGTRAVLPEIATLPLDGMGIALEILTLCVFLLFGPLSIPLMLVCGVLLLLVLKI